ncbi:FecR family protein [Chitinophaga defluvii]|uniref:FecR domain-containing protein n=1 Tax=Chitinophaga defluvii TaxID=3163343 RepID=A0ABV2TE75_9BACT
MEQHQHAWQSLLDRYINNTISPEEMELLLHKIEEGEVPESFTDALRRHWEVSREQGQTDTRAWNEKFAAMMAEEKRNNPPLKRVMTTGKRLLRYAAAVLLLVAMGTWYFSERNKTAPPAPAISSPATELADLKPGTPGAILKLSNGQEIVLDSANNGVLAIQGNTKIIRRNNQIFYDETASNQTEAVYNTITTPKGRQYQLILADGSKVWLNAASSIRYPTLFTGNKREVEITGEVYFEVAHQTLKNNRANGAGETRMPFIVKVSNAAGHGEEIEVLGTHFNINAYHDEPAVKTTLLEGSVKVSTMAGHSAVLQPGQQSAVAQNGAIHVMKAVNTDAVMAWKNGYFSFDQTDLATLMRQIGRWYDVDISYEGAIPVRKFGGEISRDNNASQVLKIMEETGVRFRIEGRKIIVLP